MLRPSRIGACHLSSVRAAGREVRTIATTEDVERAALRQADQHIAEGERHVIEQEMRIAKLREDGHNVETFEATLATFNEVLAGHYSHRVEIVKRLEQIEGGKLSY